MLMMLSVIMWFMIPVSECAGEEPSNRKKADMTADGHITVENTVRDVINHPAISWIFANAAELGVSTADYSVWGGSAGARMAGNIALNGVSRYGGGNIPKSAAAVIAYTGQSSYSNDFPPAFFVQSENDGIAPVSVVNRRVENLRNAGVAVEYRKY